jgi:DNA polymerase-3 subunit gamma/tau
MGQALYRKYRSKSFDDVVGQDHITKTLKNALAAGKINHAYLFTGPRGVGKTSVARILAHEVNSLSYTDESVHLDIIEIDAASNRRIDEIRDLRDKVNIAPSTSKFKVYIIDEVHMLTREAFNALLKTLEEPPAHCIFILATTEAHKLPETIVSRTQRFEFKSVNTQQAAKHLESIARQEKIDIDTEALELLAQFGAGSFRDSIGYLDQLSAYSKKINAEDVRSLLGLPAATEVEELLDLLSNANMPAALAKLNDLESRGIKPAAIASGLSESIRRLAKRGEVQTWQIGLLKDLLDIPASPRPQENLEVKILSVLAERPKPDVQLSAHQNNSNEEPVSGLVISADRLSEPAPRPAPDNKPSGSFDLDQWDEVIEHSKKQAASIYTALRLAAPAYADGVLTLNFQFPLHQKKLELAKNKELVAKIIKDICGQTVTIRTRLDKAPVKSEEEVVLPTVASSISSIFGAAEVIEA